MSSGDDSGALERAQREAVVAAAAGWVGTPFHDCASVKGPRGGIDCANLLARVYEEAGVTGRIDTGRYSPSWFMHRDEERFAAFVMRYAVEIPEAEAGVGDTVLYKIGRCFAHGAIITEEWPNRIIHAHKQSRHVVIARPFDGDLAGRKTRFFTMWPRTGRPPRLDSLDDQGGCPTPESGEAGQRAV